MLDESCVSNPSLVRFVCILMGIGIRNRFVCVWLGFQECVAVLVGEFGVCVHMVPRFCDYKL